MKNFIRIKNGKGSIKDTYLWKYYQDPKPKCVEMKMELENLINDLKSSEYIYDTTKSYIYMDFIEKCIRLTEDPFYDMPMKLLLWEKCLIELIYSFKMISLDSGNWVERFTEVLLWICRKNGKSQLIAALMTTELFLSPKGSTLICSGLNADISGLCYDMIDRMRLFIDPKSVITWKNQKGLRNKINDTILKKLSESSRGKEGRNIKVASIDEIHELLADVIYKPIVQSTSTKEEYKIFLFSSEGMVNNGFSDNVLRDYQAIVKGENTSISAKRKLPFIYKQDSESEVWETDENGISELWYKGNPSAGEIKLWSNLRDAVDRARISKTERPFVLAKDFNLKQSTVNSWLLPEYLEYDMSFDMTQFENYYCLGSADLSETTDLTSAKIILIKPNSRYKYILSHYWINEGKLENNPDTNAGAKYIEWAKEGYLTICEGNDNKLDLVADWFGEMKDKYKIWIHKIGYDQKFKTDFINKCGFYGWVDKEDLIMIYQSPATLHTANKQVEADLMDHLILGLNEMDIWCLNNSSLKTDSQGNTLVVKQTYEKKIDGAVTLVMAQEMVNRYRLDLLERNNYESD